MPTKTEQYFRKTLDVKTSGVSLIEGLGFGGLIIATDYVDEKMNLDQTTLKSISNTLPIVLSLASTIGVLFTKGGAQSGMNAICCYLNRTNIEDQGHLWKIF